MKIASSGKIRISSNTFVKGAPVTEGDILSVPEDVTLADAQRLIILKRATIVPPEEKRPSPEDIKVDEFIVTKAHQKLLDKIAEGKELTEKQTEDLKKFEEKRPSPEE